MAVTGLLYGLFLRNQLDGTVVDWDADTIKASLHTSTYTPAQDTDDFFDDATNQITGTGYTAGGATLTGKTITYTAGTNTIKLDAADVQWAASTLTARTAVVYKDTTVASTSPLICYQQSDVDIISTGGAFDIVWHADGIVSIVVA